MKLHKLWPRPTLEETQDTDMNIQQMPLSNNSSQEHYRVGFTTDGKTTLTIMNDGQSMTLAMSREACEQLIRMLRATYPLSEEDES